MKFGIQKKIKSLYSFYELCHFTLRKTILGFEYANILTKRVDKQSLQLILKKHGAQIGENCDIESGLTFHNCIDYSNLKIGNNCHIGKNCFFDLRDKVIIKENVVVSMQSTFITHIDMTKSELRKIFPTKQNSIVIEKNTYVSANSTVLMGVVLGQNSFIAAGTIVSKNVKPYTMVGGVPAKVIGEIQ